MLEDGERREKAGWERDYKHTEYRLSCCGLTVKVFLEAHPASSFSSQDLVRFILSH
jgi:hypothetical protein